MVLYKIGFLINYLYLDTFSDAQVFLGYKDKMLTILSLQING